MPTTSLLSTSGIQISLLVNRHWSSCVVKMTPARKQHLWSDPWVCGQQVWTSLLVTLYKWLLQNIGAFLPSQVKMENWSPWYTGFPGPGATPHHSLILKWPATCVQCSIIKNPPFRRGMYYCMKSDQVWLCVQAQAIFIAESLHRFHPCVRAHAVSTFKALHACHLVFG